MQIRTTHIHQPTNTEVFKTKLLTWTQRFEKFVWLESNNSTIDQNAYNLSEFDAILAVDMHTEIQCDCSDSFETLKEYQQTINDSIFGYLGYDLKNDIENLDSTNFDGIGFPDLYFFQPKKIFIFKNNSVEIQYLNEYATEIDIDLKEIIKGEKETIKSPSEKIKIKLRIHKDKYYSKISSVLSHILRGDIYEMCFCQEFFAEDATIDPLKAYHNLNQISTPPFATFLKLDDKFLISASPERFLKRSKNTITSQPIKGTIKRGKNDLEDKKLMQQLESDQKERAENIMIVDLVRNDLSKTALKGSVIVTELCKVYTFKQVHQLISTVASQVDPETNSIDIIKSLFPMGSMTGAPKFSALQIIEELEETKRGLYSGAVGYFTSTGDFDFNVVIRSILYNETKKYISYSVGGAITSKSIPEKEYEECLLKAKAMREVLLNN